MEFKILCKLCPNDEAWTTQAAAEAAAVWHVYTEHRESWIKIVGSDRPPLATTPPEAYGRKYEQWERQS